MYSKPRCKIVNNGYISESSNLSRGVKQGCPLSAYLFIIAIETLAVKIRSNNNIKGLEIHFLKTKVSLYVDDSGFLLKPQLGSLHSLIEDLDTFSNLSGLKTILRIGITKTLIHVTRETGVRNDGGRSA